MIYPPAATSVSVDVFFADDTGAALTGKVAADFPACKWSGGSNTADTAIALSDLAAITTAHPNDNTAGGIKEREGGWYRLDLPNNVFTAAGRKTLTFAETTNKRILAPPFDVQYVQGDLQTIKTQTVTAAAGVTFPASIGTSTLTQTQVTGGAYALNSASFAFDAGLDFTTTEKTSITAAVPTAAQNAAATRDVSNASPAAGSFGEAARNADAKAASIEITLGSPAVSVSEDIAAVKTDTGTLVSRITSTLFSGITYLSKWLGALAGKTADTATRTEINATTAGAGFNETTDSQEAIRDRGDAGWLTATGFAVAGDAMTLTSGERDSIAAALLDLSNGVESGKTIRQALRLMAAALAGKRSNAGLTTEQYDAIGSPGTARIVGNLDGSGNGTPTLTP